MRKTQTLVLKEASNISLPVFATLLNRRKLKLDGKCTYNVTFDVFNYNGHGNTKMPFIFIFEVYVALNNTKLLSVTIENRK